MDSKGNIVFLGMMGSGKTSLGSLISKKLNLDFYDTDQIIEKKVGMKISKIFKIKGENFFRKVEEEITLDILKKDNVVIALGGGTFLNKNIRDKILDSHLSFWLKWNSKTIINRINKSEKRPLAFKLDPTQLATLIRKRSKIYVKAQI